MVPGDDRIATRGPGHPSGCDIPSRPRITPGAKEELRRRMTPNRKYTEKADQSALTAQFDLATAYRRCRSFRRLVNVFGLIAAGTGITLDQWPPTDWMTP